MFNFHGTVFCPQAVAGLLADARSLSEVAREEASNFRSNYGHDIPLKVNYTPALNLFIINSKFQRRNSQQLGCDQIK